MIGHREVVVYPREFSATFRMAKKLWLPASPCCRLPFSGVGMFSTKRHLTCENSKMISQYNTTSQLNHDYYIPSFMGWITITNLVQNKPRTKRENEIANHLKKFIIDGWTQVECFTEGLKFNPRHQCRTCICRYLASPNFWSLNKCNQWLDLSGSWTLSRFSQEGPINTRMHKIGTNSTNFQSVKEKI